MAETLLLLSGRTTLLEPALAEGQVAELSLNPDGRLRVASKQGWFPATTGPLTTAAQTLAVDVTDASNVVLHVKNTGTAAMAAGAFVFEGSIDSTNGTDGAWFVVQAVRSDSNTIETGRGTSSLAAGAGQLYAWELSLNAVRWFRIRCSTTLTASAIAMWTIVRGSYATEPIPAMQTHAVTGSGTFTVAGTATVTPAAPTMYNALGLAATTGVVVKASSGQLIELCLFNPTAATIYFKLYNKSTAPAVATDSAVLLATIAVPSNTEKIFEFGQMGKRLLAGISYALTAGAGNTDASAPATAGLVISASYL